MGNHAGDWGMDTPDGPVCVHDSENGKVKSGEAIFEGGVAFFMSEVASGDRDLAERLTRKNMKMLPYWQTRPFAALDGPEATDAEFHSALAKL